MNKNHQNKTKLAWDRGIFERVVESLLSLRKPGRTVGLILEAVGNICLAALSLLIVLAAVLMNKNQGWWIFAFSGPLTCLCGSFVFILGMWCPPRRSQPFNAIMTLTTYSLLLSGVCSNLFGFLLPPVAYVLTGSVFLSSGPNSELNPSNYLSFSNILGWNLFITFSLANSGIFLSMNYLYRLTGAGRAPTTKPFWGKERKIHPLNIRWKYAPLFLRKDRARLWFLYKKAPPLLKRVGLWFFYIPKRNKNVHRVAPVMIVTLFLLVSAMSCVVSLILVFS